MSTWSEKRTANTLSPRFGQQLSAHSGSPFDVGRQALAQTGASRVISEGLPRPRLCILGATLRPRARRAAKQPCAPVTESSGRRTSWWTALMQGRECTRARRAMSRGGQGRPSAARRSAGLLSWERCCERATQDANEEGQRGRRRKKLSRVFLTRHAEQAHQPTEGSIRARLGGGPAKVMTVAKWRCARRASSLCVASSASAQRTTAQHAQPSNQSINQLTAQRKDGHQKMYASSTSKGLPFLKSHPSLFTPSSSSSPFSPCQSGNLRENRTLLHRRFFFR